MAEKRRRDREGWLSPMWLSRGERIRWEMWLDGFRGQNPILRWVVGALRARCAESARISKSRRSGTPKRGSGAPRTPAPAGDRWTASLCHGGRLQPVDRRTHRDRGQRRVVSGMLMGERTSLEGIQNDTERSRAVSGPPSE